MHSGRANMPNASDRAYVKALGTLVAKNGDSEYWVFFKNGYAAVVLLRP